MLTTCVRVEYQTSASEICTHEKGRGVPVFKGNGFGVSWVDRRTGHFEVRRPALPILIISIDGAEHAVVLWPNLLKKRLPITRMTKKIVPMIEKALPPTIDVEQCKGQKGSTYYTLTEETVTLLCDRILPIL